MIFAVSILAQRAFGVSTITSHGSRAIRAKDVDAAKKIARDEAAKDWPVDEGWVCQISAVGIPSAWIAETAEGDIS